jgi:hypothetical protein
MVPGAMSWKWLAQALMIWRGIVELPARQVAHARTARHVAAVVEGDDAVVVLLLVEADRTALDQVPGQFADVGGLLVAVVQLVLQFDGERVLAAGTDAHQRVPEAVGHAPGVAAFTHHDALDAEFQRRFADAQRDLAQLLVVADEHAEVAGLAGLAGQRPADARGVEDLAVADQALDMRLGKEVGDWA